MFKPLPMRHVVLQILTEDLPMASLTLAELGIFSPDFRPYENEKFPDNPGQRYRELYHQARSHLKKIGTQVQLTGRPPMGEIHEVSEEALQATNEWLGQAWARCFAFAERLRGLADGERTIDQLEQTLENFAELNIDLSLLQGEKRFLDIHIGMLPRENIDQLKEAVSLAGYLLFTYMEHGESTHIVLLGAKERRDDGIAQVLDTAGFRALPIPAELRDQPERVKTALSARRNRLRSERAQATAAMQACGDELRQRLEESRRILVMAEPLAAIDNAVRSTGSLTIITGWIPAREVRRTEQALRQAMPNPFQLTTRAPQDEERHQVPSFMPKSRLTAPFATLVKQYGIPRYGEVDPTVIFTLTFIAMFGMMFGDIGHGLVIMLAAWLGRKKLRSFTAFAICAGLSACLFGALYGSIFGYEGLFHALWIPPLSDPLYMLSMALLWGIGFLILITLISIHNRLAAGDVNRALFDTNGLVSIVLYLSVLTGIHGLYSDGRFGIPAAVIGMTALLTLLGFKLIEARAPPGERMLVAFIETLETLTGYTSNTLSFLRVAAFSLNHVALAIAVFTLADMMDETGRWLMIIGGNLFILILEGAIVTIQVLRLEYYEGFSRYFSGDGLEFKPLRLNWGASDGENPTQEPLHAS